MPNSEIPDALIRANNERILTSIVLIVPKEIDTAKPEESVSETNNKNSLSPDEIAFLWDVYNRPFVSVTERYKTFNLGG